MSRSITILGSMDGLRGYLEERLERAGAKLVKEQKHVDFTICIGINERCDLSVVPYGTDNPLSTVSIGLEDVIIPSRAKGWGNGKLLDWIDCIKKGHDPLIEDGVREMPVVAATIWLAIGVWGMLPEASWALFTITIAMTFQNIFTGKLFFIPYAPAAMLFSLLTALTLDSNFSELTVLIIPTSSCF